MKKRIFIIFIYIFIFMLIGGNAVQALTECEEFNVTGTKVTELDGVIEMSTVKDIWNEVSITKYENQRNIYV